MNKELIQKALDESPARVDIDTFIEKLYLLNKIQVAEEQIAAGQGIAHEDALRRLEPWLK